ncbi:MAG: hypothetical protein CSA84_06945 [Actinomycetales bacterium]|nr:MAG: hypothetical protein CSA84_06945 [Actinomycetales bacterium]
MVPTQDSERPASVRRQRHAVLLRLDPVLHAALARWADDELRSVNAQVDLVIRQALATEGRLPTGTAPPPRRGRPRSDREQS